jgi:RHS repeat-associated protein
MRANFMYNPGGQRAAMPVGSSMLYWLLTDHLSSTAVTANSSGGRYGELRHKAWGKTRYTYGTTPTASKFTGQRLDDATGLYYYGVRYYDAALGRFVQADTLVPEPGNPQDLNRYSYTRNNPLRYTDPSGLFTEEELINWGVYTAEKLKWLAEHQANWYTYLMKAAVGDAFWFVNGTDAFGSRQFQLSDGTLTIAGGAFAWKDKFRLPSEVGQGSVRQWGVAIGQAAIHSWPLEPEKQTVQWLPNLHIQLSGQAAEMNAGFVLGWDFGVALLSTGGWFIVGLDTLLAPPDPTGKMFGYALANVGSAAATLTLLDTLATSGPNSQAMTVNVVTYTAGWASLMPGFPPSIPIDLAAAWGQVRYDYYTLQRIERQNRR